MPHSCRTTSRLGLRKGQRRAQRGLPTQRGCPATAVHLLCRQCTVAVPPLHCLVNTHAAAERGATESCLRPNALRCRVCCCCNNSASCCSNITNCCNSSTFVRGERKGSEVPQATVLLQVCHELVGCVALQVPEQALNVAGQGQHRDELACVAAEQQAGGDGCERVGDVSGLQAPHLV